jgi:hypothetical protein
MPPLSRSDQMLHRFPLTAAAALLLLAPGAALAQTTASSEIDLSSTVTASCGVGAPSLTVLDLHELSGPDGRLDSSKRSSSTLASTTIADAWCNAPNKLTFGAKAMTLQEARTYAQPAYMARDITYDATLVGWGPFDWTRRPHTGDDSISLASSGPYATSSSGLVLNISKLETMTAAKTEDSSLMLEAGHYKGTVTITLTTVN